MSVRSPSLALVAVAVCFAVAGAVALALPALGQGDSSAPELRPDLVQRLPGDLVTRIDDGRHSSASPPRSRTAATARYGSTGAATPPRAT